MGPLLIGGGGVVSIRLREEPEMGFESESEGVRVVDESPVNFLEMALEFE
jgi:hypothetical protein